jgi:hypothetical protein
MIRRSLLWFPTPPGMSPSGAGKGERDRHEPVYGQRVIFGVKFDAEIAAA